MLDRPNGSGNQVITSRQRLYARGKICARHGRTEFVKHPPKILVVEHHTPTATLLTVLLTRAGCEKKQIASGREALALLQKETFNLVTLGLDLSDMDGFELFQRLRKNLKLSATPIVFISGRSDESSWQRGLELGAADYIEKPFGGSTFTRRILSHLEIKQKLIV